MKAEPDSLLNPTLPANWRELEEVAQRLCWWRPPAEAIHDQHRFVAQVMALGTDRDIDAVLRAFGESVFEKVLDKPPPGLFTPRRWHYWHVRFRRLPSPPLPQRFQP
jgi:hypothetical protein